MDLVSCRNTLIYFKSKPQANAIQKLQYAVKHQCVLLLGKSESLTINTSHFEAIDAQLKLFRCIQSVKVLEFESVANSSISLLKKRQVISTDMNSNMKSIIEHGQSLLQDKFVPTALLVNGVFDVVHFYGEPGVLFKYSQGPVSTNISHMLDRALVPIVTSLLIRLKKESEHVLTDNILTKVNDQSRNVTITAELLDNSQLQNYYLLTIEIQKNEINELAMQVDKIDDNVKKYISQLEEQLSATRESLQVTIEELETTNEELQATNEELMASNEELQSSNEELQSLNEELNTVNSEYHEKLNIVNQTNADLDALSKATAVATIFIDQDFHISRFTPDACKIFKLRNTDIGRPLEEIAHSLDYAFLHKDIQQTINTGQLLEKKVQSIEGKLYLVRLVDYRLSPIKSGLVISFVDVTALKISDQLNSVLDALPEHLAVLDRAGDIQMVNLAWERFAQHNGQNPSVSSIGQNYLAACLSEEADNKTNEAYKGVKSVLDGHVPRFCMEYPCHSPDEKRFFAMEVVAISHPQFAAVVSHFNISSWKNMEDENI